MLGKVSLYKNGIAAVAGVVRRSEKVATRRAEASDRGFQNERIRESKSLRSDRKSRKVGEKNREGEDGKKGAFEEDEGNCETTGGENTKNYWNRKGKGVTGPVRVQYSIVSVNPPGETARSVELT